jgi:hypothetical protein
MPVYSLECDPPDSSHAIEAAKIAMRWRELVPNPEHDGTDDTVSPTMPNPQLADESLVELWLANLLADGIERYLDRKARSERGRANIRRKA